MTRAPDPALSKSPSTVSIRRPALTTQRDGKLGTPSTVCVRTKFGVGGKAAPKSSKKPKPNPVLKSYAPPNPKPQPVPNPDLAPKPKSKSRRKAKRSPFNKFGNRYIDRAALGYAPADESKGSQAR